RLPRPADRRTGHPAGPESRAVDPALPAAYLLFHHLHQSDAPCFGQRLRLGLPDSDPVLPDAWQAPRHAPGLAVHAPGPAALLPAPPAAAEPAGVDRRRQCRPLRGTDSGVRPPL